jgi:hypothetical protein
MATIPVYETTLKIPDSDLKSGETVRTGPVVGSDGWEKVAEPILPFSGQVTEIPPFNPNAPFNPKGGAGTADGVAPGAAPKSQTVQPAQAEMSNTQKQDFRVTIKVPSFYRNGAYEPGIIFPYTPQISLEHKADFTPQNPLHSNYSLQFYKSSSVSDISIQGLFTVQNDSDATQYLAAVHLLRALTKGRFGGTDQFRGSAPPICRLMAYGGYMLNNVPVSIASFKQDFPSDVDYYYLNKTTDASLGPAMVPTRCTISVVCKLMISRSEMLTASVNNWLSGVSRKAGLL